MSSAALPPVPARALGERLPVVFMYSGQGSQYHHMGAELYREDARFRQVMQELDEIAARYIGESVIRTLYDAGRRKSDPFERTRITHQAIFMVQYALTRVLTAQGITPALLLGASLGEVTAAAVSGMLTVEECIGLLFENARLLESRCRRGGMLAVLHDSTLYARDPILQRNSEIAAVNGDSHFIIAGGLSELGQVTEHLNSREILHQLLPVEYAFHSSWIEPSRAEFCSYLAALPSRAAEIPVVSCATTNTVEAVTGEHFWSVFRRPIELSRTVRQMEERGRYLYLDVGPSGTLATLAKPIVAPRGVSTTCPTLTPFGQDQKALARATAMCTGS